MKKNKKIKNKINKIFKSISSYLLTNRLFILYVVITFIGCLLLKKFTVGGWFELRSVLTEIGMILILGSFCYLTKPKNQYNYLFTLICIFTLLFFANTIYYKFFTTFASVGEIASLSQAETVTGSVFEKVKLIDLIFILIPFIFYYLHNKLKNSSYYEYVSKIEKGSLMFVKTLIVGLAFLAVRFSFATKTDYGSLAKQWNRASVVQRFGIILYQGNDIFQTLTPKIGSLFGYDDAVELFKNFYNNYPNEEHTNKYTGLFEGMNVVFVHMESIQTFLMDQKYNDKELTPNLNNLAKEGLFFSNFYPQISTGTSSDSEFTLLSSLMPAASGTIFVSYFNRNYVTTPKLLTEKGYYTFSMHGNASNMWNRNKAHPSLGYQGMYFKESFEFTDEDVINLGINDKQFFKQAIPILENVETTYDNYMGTVITLSNHSPFTFIDKYGEYDLSESVTKIDPTTKKETVEKTNYLEGTAVGNYLHSVHYADDALGDFIEYIKNSDYFNNTIFVFYGDHDAKLSKNNLNYLYNHNPETGEVYSENDENYKEYDSFDHSLNKKTPLIIWTKNKSFQSKLPSTYDGVMGMYDVMPTIGNLFGFYNPYALGHDIFEINDDNIVIFPNGDFLTNYIYYNNSSGEYKILKEGAVLDDNYIEERVKYVDDHLGVSNAIVVYDLLSEEHLKSIKENDNNEKEK